MTQFIRSIRLVSLTLLLIASTSSFAQKPVIKGGGSPGPFSDSNQKVELADGETYYLQGELYELHNGDLAFAVDFKAHPWLANRARKQRGYYLISESKSKINLNRVLDKKVSMNFKARAIILEDNKGNTRADIELKPLSTPELIR